MPEQGNILINSDQNPMTPVETKAEEAAVAERIDKKASQRTLSRTVPVFLAAGAVVLVVVVIFGIHSRNPPCQGDR
jgi:hypothetical protein